MKNLWWIIRATFRAAIWKSTPGHPSLTIRAVLFWMVVSMASDAAGEYFGIDGAAAFSLYGVNSIIAGAALVAGVAILFVSRDRAVALSQLFALVTLLDWAVIAATHITSFELIPLAVTAVLLAAAPRILSRHRDIAFAQILTACVLADLAAITAVRLPIAWPNLAPGMWTAMDTRILLLTLTFVWAVGAVAAILRGAGVGPYESPCMRAFGLCLASVVAIAALPNFPTFVGRDFDLHSYNLWEIASAKFRSAGERNTAPRLDATATELSQPTLLEAEVGNLLPERKGTADIYAIGMAGWSEQDVFVKELNGGLAALERSIGMDRGAIRLVNHLDTIETLPVASPTNFASAVHSIAGIMNKDEDVLLIFITSHGGPTGVGLLLADAVHTVLSPDHVASVLDREGIKNRLLIVSACYSGGFVKRLASPNSVILTASDENSPSFGCSNEREWTYFGDALFNLNLRPGVSLEESFENAKLQISRWEARDGVDPSNPQGFFGASLASKLKLSRGPVHRAAAEE